MSAATTAPPPRHEGSCRGRPWNTALTGATHDIDRGQQLVAR